MALQLAKHLTVECMLNVTAMLKDQKIELTKLVRDNNIHMNVFMIVFCVFITQEASLTLQQISYFQIHSYNMSILLI